MVGRNCNVSTYFVLPMLPGVVRYYMFEFLLNTYIRVDDTDCIALLYKQTDNETLAKLFNAFQKFRQYKKTVDINKDRVLYVFEIPSLFTDDFKKILNGQYSQVSELLKKRIIDFYDLQYDSSILGILYKDKKRKKCLEERLNIVLPKDIELFEQFNLTKETI